MARKPLTDRQRQLQEAEKQKQKLKEQLELRERQMEEASARKVAAIAAEREAAAERVLQLREELLLEQASQRLRAAQAVMAAARSLTCSRASCGRASGWYPERPAATAWYRLMPWASRSWVMTADR
jgi:hypothetical protein